MRGTGKASKIYSFIPYLKRNGPTVNAAHQPLLLQFEQITPHAGFRGSENFTELLEVDKLLMSKKFLNLQNSFGLAHVIPLTGDISILARKAMAPDAQYLEPF
jgi:hypothetical protein